MTVMTPDNAKRLAAAERDRQDAELDASINWQIIDGMARNEKRITVSIYEWRHKPTLTEAAIKRFREAGWDIEVGYDKANGDKDRIPRYLWVNVPVEQEK